MNNSQASDDTTGTNLTVGLFITCAVDLLRPSIGFATIKLLENAGCTIVVPAQSCCGQMAYNNGLPDQTRQLALNVVDAFQHVDYVVAPSGSCASMLKNHYPELFDHTNPKVNQFAERVYELTCFLVDVLKIQKPAGGTQSATRTIAYHDSCAGLRELGIKAQPRVLISQAGDDTVIPIEDGETCCGFGGTFCVKFADISNKMATNKAESISALTPDLLLGGDLTCLLNLAGKLQRQGEEQIQIRHIAEYLADHLTEQRTDYLTDESETPAIGLDR